MKAGFKVKTAWKCGIFNNSLVVSNYSLTNEIVNYPMVHYSIKQKTTSDVGMWRIKTLKK
jgi:hypothetical protein